MGEKGKFWYSEKQRHAIMTGFEIPIGPRERSALPNARLADGSIVEYTEMKTGDTPSAFDDAVYLGEGESLGS